MINLSLNPVPDKKWQKEYDKLIQDPYIQKKCNREKRLKQKELYIDMYASEIKTEKPGLVIDLGPGPGEFLELARYYGHEIAGFDAKIEDCEMGNEYILFSKLMAERQNLNITYNGFEFGFSKLKTNSILYISSQGSIEQIFKQHLIGVPHKEHKNCNKLTWSMDNKMSKDFYCFFEEIQRILIRGGTCLIYANGAINVQKYDKFIKELISQFPYLDLTYTAKNVIHKIKRI